MKLVWNNKKLKEYNKHEENMDGYRVNKQQNRYSEQMRRVPSRWIKDPMMVFRTIHGKCRKKKTSKPIAHWSIMI